eukprot:TRINITY_DN10630_c0_g1_i1.p1 TRINITY_DN10630_c0_g1~~TRINITY_DN10630_c0_g1_i1.p1  ORF type:complete len:427 (-),score=69.42 TRINITY_DN10630_c0_g1_i1:521-1801(-)
MGRLGGALAQSPAYNLFLAENRDSIVNEIGSKNSFAISAAASRKWKALTAEQHASFEQRAASARPPSDGVDRSRADAGDKEAAAAAAGVDAGVEANPNASARVNYRGVRLKPSGAFAAEITHAGKKTNIGTFATPEEAARAYNKVAIELKGAEAVLNEGVDKNVQTSEHKRKRDAGDSDSGGMQPAQLQDSTKPVRDAANKARRLGGKVAQSRGYALFLCENRDAIVAETGSKNTFVISAAARRRWTSMTPEQHASYEQREVVPSGGANSLAGAAGGSEHTVERAIGSDDSDDDKPLCIGLVESDMNHALSSSAKARPKGDGDGSAEQALSEPKSVPRVRGPSRPVQHHQATKQFKALVEDSVKKYIKERPDSWTLSEMGSELAEEHGWEEDKWLKMALKTSLKNCGFTGLSAFVPQKSTGPRLCG